MGAAPPIDRTDFVQAAGHLEHSTALPEPEASPTRAHGAASTTAPAPCHSLQPGHVGDHPSQRVALAIHNHRNGARAHLHECMEQRRQRDKGQ